MHVTPKHEEGTLLGPKPTYVVARMCLSRLSLTQLSLSSPKGDLPPPPLFSSALSCFPKPCYPPSITRFQSLYFSQSSLPGSKCFSLERNGQEEKRRKEQKIVWFHPISHLSGNPRLNHRKPLLLTLWWVANPQGIVLEVLPVLGVLLLHTTSLEALILVM